MGSESFRIQNPATADPQVSQFSQSSDQDRDAFSPASLIAQILLGPDCRDVACYVATLGTAIDQLSPSQRRALEEQTGGLLNQFLSLARETDAELFFEGLLDLARRLENADLFQLPASIYSAIASSSSLPLFPSSPLLQRQAQERLASLQGTGTFWDQAEFFGRRILTQSRSLEGLAGMAAGGFFSHYGRFLAATRILPRISWNLFTRPLVRRSFTYGFGFGTEVLGFTAAVRGTALLMGRELDWTGSALGHELAGGALTLGPLHLFGGLARRFVGRLPRSGGGTPPLQWIIPQLAMFTGIMVGHEAEELVGLREERSFESALAEGFTTWAQFNIAGAIMGRLMSARYRAWQQAVDRATEQTLDRPGASANRRTGELPPRRGAEAPDRPLVNLLLSPLWMFLGAGGIGGGGPRRPSHRRAGQPPLLLPPSSPHSERIRRFLTNVPDLPQRGLVEVAEYLFQSYAMEEQLPSHVWLGRALRGAPPETVVPWLDYVFEIMPGGAEAETDQIYWLQIHHIQGGLPRIREYLHHPEPMVRRDAVQALPDFLGDAAVPELLTALSDPNPEVKVGASGALMRLGVNAPLPRERSEISAQTQESFERLLAERGAMAREPEFVTEREVKSLRAMETSALIEIMNSPQNDLLLRQMALLELGNRRAVDAIFPLRELLSDENFFEGALLALDLIDPNWDQNFRGMAQVLMETIVAEWAQAATDRPWRETSQRLWEEFRNVGKDPARSLGLLLVLGDGMMDFSSVENGLGALSVLLFLGLGMAGSSQPPRPRREVSIHNRPTVILNRSGNSPPSPPTSSPPPEPVKTLDWAFENAFDPQEKYPIPQPPAEGELTLGRSTPAKPNLFPPEFRSISREHLDLRYYEVEVNRGGEIQREGRIKVRAHEKSYGLRVNHANLMPRQWYELKEGDLLEFVSESRNSSVNWELNQWGEEWIQKPHRLGEDLLAKGQYEYGSVDEQLRIYSRAHPLQPADYPPTFRLRRLRPEQPAQSSASTLLERASQLWRNLRESVRPPAAPESAPATKPESILEQWPFVPVASPHPILSDPETLRNEIHQLSSRLSGGIRLLDMGLQNQVIPQHPQEALKSLWSVHEYLCGPLRSPTPTPPWFGRITELLNFYQTSLEILRRNHDSPVLTEIQAELNRLNDRFNRLMEIVGVFRSQYPREEEYSFLRSADAEQRVFGTRRYPFPMMNPLLMAVEGAYFWLRPDSSPELTGVVSDTGEVNAVIQTTHRQAWMEAFLAQNPLSRAAFNARILLGEITQVEGEPVAGNFYQALRKWTYLGEDGLQAVRAYYDMEGGEIFAISDGSQDVFESIGALRSQGRHLEGITIMVDIFNTGRIVDVVGITPETRDTIRAALRQLIGLQVLPETKSGGTQPDTEVLWSPGELEPTSEQPMPQQALAIDYSNREIPVFYQIIKNPPPSVRGRYRVQSISDSQPFSDGTLWRQVCLQRPRSLRSYLWVREGEAADLEIEQWVSLEPVT